MRPLCNISSSLFSWELAGERTPLFEKLTFTKAPTRRLPTVVPRAQAIDWDTVLKYMRVARSTTPISRLSRSGQLGINENGSINLCNISLWICSKDSMFVNMNPAIAERSWSAPQGSYTPFLFPWPFHPQCFRLRTHGTVCTVCRDHGGCWIGN